MYHMIGTVKQYNELKHQSALLMPIKVWGVLKEKVTIMDNYYGKDRDIETDMGGYCVIFPSDEALDKKEYESILTRYYLRCGEWEYRERHSCEESLYDWMEELYLVSSDYGVIIFYPITESEEDHG